MRGDRLKELREKRGYSREKLADLLGVGFSNIYRYEAGRNDPSSEIVKRMAELFNVSVDYLVGLTDEPHGHNHLKLSDYELEILTAIRRGDNIQAIRLLAAEK